MPEIPRSAAHFPTWPPNGLGVPHSYTLFCPPLPTSPRTARDFVATVLHSLELVTNAVAHAPGVWCELHTSAALASR